MTNKDDIFLMLKNVLVDDFEIDESQITLSANLFEDLDLDSIDAVDLVIKIRDHSGIKIEPEAFKQVRTVDDVVNALTQLIG